MSEASGGQAPRVIGVDAARGLALIGMFVAHTAPMAATADAQAIIAIADERPRLLFALTAGLALGFISGGIRPLPAARGFAGGPERRRLRRQIAIRAVILIALGLLITEYLRPLVFVILDVYGVAFLVLIPLLFLPRWVALGIGIAGLAVAPGLAVLLAREDWVVQARGTWLELPAAWFVSGAYPVIEWVPVMLIGVAIARFGATRPRVVGTTAAVGAVAGIAFLPIGVELLRLGTRQFTDPALVPEAVRTLALGESLQALGNVGIGAVVVAVLVALTALAGARTTRITTAVLSPVTAMGAMPLTIYTAQLIVLAGSKRVENGIETDDSWPLLLALVVGSMVFAWCWRRWIGRGPLEELLRIASGRRRDGRRGETPPTDPPSTDPPTADPPTDRHPMGTQP
ncbi:heparan-alpha-glucosaminide N-acetyltransferase domain-containing protein [Agromyces sp. LHK192]|uniref:heparan-alpha-glucosaminide N-acetyltransferase domain-containing protein n=1 Tax=Agromyces sp. LHK192 TaxID=2498704 RepID=UPI0013E32A8C|nr:heparan-alpha-glucosaminide N-acetyltransferase domain-containing protein [Agromyces sp. LHK192]